MKEVTINIDRKFLNTKYTIGRISVDGIYVSDTIEDTVRTLKTIEDKVYGETAIPAGTYNGDIYFSKKFGYEVIRIFDVPFFEGIYIHRGNTQKDSLGCVIVGYNDKKGWVSRPTVAMNKLISLCKGADKIKIIVK